MVVKPSRGLKQHVVKVGTDSPSAVALCSFPLILMGCSSSTGKDAAVDKERRRLSVGSVSSSPADEGSGKNIEEERGLISDLSNQSIEELLKNVWPDNGRKCSVSSVTDQGKASYANKPIQTFGNEDLQTLGLGYTCRKGLKPESPNQDSWFILKVHEDFSIYAVFDGHGAKGHDVSNFVKENLPKLMMRDQRFKTDEMPDMLKDCFRKTQSLITCANKDKKMDANLAGTTATVCVHDHQKNKLTIAHVADSTAVISSWSDNTEMKAEKLTRDHKPDLPDEKKRIERNGGRVIFDGYANHRVYAKGQRYPGLNMSRCLGDLMGHQEAGISCEPEVSERVLTDDDKVLLLCSDGVWEFINPIEASQIVCKFKPNRATSAAEQLAKEAWDRWIREEGGAVVDDITVVLVYLQP